MYSGIFFLGYLSKSLYRIVHISFLKFEKLQFLFSEISQISKNDFFQKTDRIFLMPKSCRIQRRNFYYANRLFPFLLAFAIFEVADSEQHPGTRALQQALQTERFTKRSELFCCEESK